MAFTKITDADLQNKGVIGLPDTPGLSTTEMQEKFDEIALDVLYPKHNGLIDEMEASSAAANIGAVDVNGNASTVQTELNNIKQGGYTKQEADALLNGKVDKVDGKGLSTNDFTDAYKTKLNNIEDNANNYVLPKGSQDTLGGVMGDGTTFTIDSNGVGHAVGGGGGGTSDYSALINKPSINHVELIGDKDGSEFGFLSPVITITSDAGSTVKIKKGTTEITATQLTTTTWEAIPSSYGTWTVSSTLAGADEATGTVEVDAVKVYTTTVEHITATITATYPNGATCRCYKGSTEYIATQNPQTFTVRSLGTWYIETTYNGITKSATTTITADGDSQSVTIEYATINVTYDNNFRGKTITCTDGSSIYTKTAPSDANTVSFTIPNTGTWTVRGEVGGVTYSQNVVVSSYTSYSASLAVFNATITATFPASEGATCVCNGVTATTSPYTFNIGSTGTYSVVCTLDGVSMTESVTITTDGQSESKTFTYGTINLTYANEFRGLTITCVKGGTTISKTAPSASNSLTFYPDTTGEWTISGTYSGVTYSTSATVVNLGTAVSALLQTLPDGSTVTPTDDIQKWLACAGITDKTYTTLAEVLNDSTTLLALISSNNAVDYLVRSNSFATAVGLVPTMTSNTTPSGEASASSVFSGAYLAYHAFDNTSNGWHPEKSGTQQWIQYEFPSACIVRKLTFKVVNGVTSHQGNVKLRGSNDGSTFTDVDTFIDGGWNGASYTSPVAFTFTNNTAYKYYRVEFNNAVEWNFDTGIKLQFYMTAENEGLCDNSTAMTDIGANNYCANTLLDDATWCTAICNSTYFESVLNTKVPTMTSNTTPSGVASANDEYTSIGFYAWKAFDGVSNVQDGWYTNTLSNQWIKYQFTSAVKVYKMVHTSWWQNGNASQSLIKEWKLQGSNDDATYTDLVSGTDSSTGILNISTLLNPSTSYNYYKFNVLETYISGAGLRELQFYGRQDI